MSRLREQLGQARFTRGALVVAIIQLVCSLGYLVLDLPTRAKLAEWLVASPSNVFEHGRIWTLVTGPLLELDFIALVMSLLLLWMFVPTLERFWGTGRFYRFVLITSAAGSLAGCLVGLATHHDVPIAGLSPFVYASVVAFGIVYAQQPVQFSFYLKMTGRQMMYGFLGFLVLFVGLQGLWEKGGSFAGGMIAAVVLTSKRWNLGLMLRRWRIARARARLSVIEGGLPKPPSPRKKSDDQRFIN